MGKKSRPSFSQREGFEPIKNVIQVNSIDEDLRNSLWNALHIWYWRKVTRIHIIDDKDMCIWIKLLWLNFFKLPVDTLSEIWVHLLEKIRKYYFACKWNKVYDFIEFIARNYPNTSINKEFMNSCNFYLEKELSAYRFVGGILTTITSEEEITEIEEALGADFLKPVHTHLKTALSLFSDRKSPDYRNSIKESISAVEAISRLITKKPKATLGDALKKIESKVDIHVALKKAFNKLYGYTSDEQGIRHSLLDESNLDFEDAKFMLVACSAFINYLILKSSKAGIRF